jgi:hypothetical protein
VTEAPQAFPLTWPFGWPRTAPAARRPAAFRTVTKGLKPDGTPRRKSDGIRLVDARERLAELRRYILDNLERIDIRKVEKHSFVSLIAQVPPDA